MKARNLYQILVIFSLALFITACPGADPEDLVDLSGSITIVNNTSNTFTTVNIDENCTNGWSGEFSSTLNPNSSGTYTVNSSIATDTFDVRVCDSGKTTCYIWFNNAAVAGTSDTLNTDFATGPVSGSGSC
ncbi:MAG: hypothetical protein BMS9Abin36_1885 [Gammaproteobacteria bacterium]|nr:MAG: hypothetical protein BMS9Abin36_1885 [Gammaproteobacteria bacterium]